MPISAELKQRLHERFDKTGVDIPVDLLAQVLKKQQVQSPFEKDDLSSAASGSRCKNSYQGIVRYAEIRDRDNALQDGRLSAQYSHFVDFKAKLTEAKTFFDHDQNKEYGSYTLDFVLFDESRAGGHFSRLSVTIERSGKITIQNTDTHYPDGVDARKNSPENNVLQRTLLEAVNQALYESRYDIHPYQMKDQWQPGPSQSAAMCADEVVSDLLGKYTANNPLARNVAQNASARRKQFVEMIAEAFDNDDAIEALLVARDSDAKSKDDVVQPSQQITEHLKTQTDYDCLPSDAEKKTFLTKEFDDLCKSMTGAWGSEGISIVVAKEKNNDRVSVNNNESTAVFTVAKQGGATSEITLTRTYNPEQEEIKRSITGKGLSWSQRCQLFAAAAKYEAGDQTTITLTDITVPRGATGDKKYDGLQSDITNAQQLSSEIKTCIAMYLEKFDKVIYKYNGQPLTFSLDKNKSLVGGDQVASVTSNANSLFAPSGWRPPPPARAKHTPVGSDDHAENDTSLSHTGENASDEDSPAPTPRP